ncbi:MAG TPA: sigma-70 family RNA polymerase sigma factor [Solirubrobacteraceae bacterium]|nr:sigma-70 family RNA polymerase sigma factor [Solirubrobacteraceae bacterium]
MSDGPPPFQRFLDCHRDAVWRFLVASVGRAEAEDCFQETFLSALRAYPELHDARNLRGWVLTIANRKALDAHRARARRAVPVADATTVDARSVSDTTRAEEAVWAAVRALPERQRSAVVLRYVADMPHREIAATIGCSEDAARRSLHEGLTKLREAVT